MLAVALMMTSERAAAQSSCTAQSEPERARCEQAQRVEKACAGQTGDALAACRKKAMEPQPERRDSSRLPEGYGRNKCEDEPEGGAHAASVREAVPGGARGFM